MKMSDQLFFLKNKILKIENVILIIIIAFILTAIFACITAINFAVEGEEATLQHSVGRTVLIENVKNDEELNKIKKIAHVEVVDSEKYRFEISIDAVFEKRNVDIELKSLLDENELQIVKGDNLKNDGEIVCPLNSFLVDSDVDSEGDSYKKYLVDGKKLIGKNIILRSDKDEYVFNFVGTFKNIVMDDIGTCYISKNDFDKFKDNCASISDDICNEYSMYMVRVDNYNYLESVESTLEEMGYHPFRVLDIDSGFLKKLTYISLFICSIVLIISMTILYNFFRKKSYNDQVMYGILKSIGFNYKNIEKVAVMEGIIIYLMGVVLSFVIYSIGYLIVSKKYLVDLILANFVLSIPWMCIFIFIIVSILYVIFIIKIFTKKRVKLSVNRIFGEE